MAEVKQPKDLMYELISNPSRETFREFMIGNTGEADNIEFKSEWIWKGSLSKLLLALANSGGGIVVFGIQEKDDGTNDPIGIERFEDKADISDSIKKYVPVTLDYIIHDLSFDKSEYEKLENKKFQVIHVYDTPQLLPFVSLAETTGIEKDVIYIRRGTKCEKAKAEELEKIINRRIETQFSSSSTLKLNEHLKQLAVLFKELEKDKRIQINEGSISALLRATSALSNFGAKYENKPNPLYPAEDYENFIVRMIMNKKIKIEKVLDLK